MTGNSSRCKLVFLKIQHVGIQGSLRYTPNVLDPLSAEKRLQLLQIDVYKRQVYLIASWCLQQGKEPTITVAAAGLAIGELSSMLLALPAAYLHFIKKAYPAGRLPSGTLYRKAAGASKTQLIRVYGRSVSYTHLLKETGTVLTI